jgi:hypothetical protein
MRRRAATGETLMNDQLDNESDEPTVEAFRFVSDELPPPVAVETAGAAHSCAEADQPLDRSARLAGGGVRRLPLFGRVSPSDDALTPRPSWRRHKQT